MSGKFKKKKEKRTERSTTRPSKEGITTREHFISHRMWQRTDRRTKELKLKRKLGEQREKTTKNRKKDRKRIEAAKKVNKDRVEDLGDCAFGFS